MRGRIIYAMILGAALGRGTAAATDRWIEVRSAEFTVLSDAHEKEVRRILDQFERMRWVFQTLFPKANVDPAEPIEVVAAKDGKTFAGMEPADYLGRGKLRLGGYFLHTLEKNYILLRLDAEFQHPYASVYHEYTHLQFSSASEWMPLWLNEGLAEFMENTEIHNRDVVLGAPSGEQILYLRDHALVPLRVLLKVDAASPYYHEDQKATVFYAESWALTHFLMMTDRARRTHRLDDYIALLMQKEDPVTAAEKAFGDLEQLERALSRYILAGQYKEFVMSSAAAPIDESSYKAKTLTETQAEALRADVLARVRRTAEARSLIDTVLKEDPTNVQAHETMGYLAILEKDPAEARKWYAEAVKLDSQDYLAHYYFAMLTMDMASQDEEEAIEASLRTAIRLNPHFAPAYDRLSVFLESRREKLEEAHWLSLRAVSLDPGNALYRMDAANVFMSMGRDADALTALKGAAKVAKNPTEIAMVRNQAQRIEEDEAERAQEERYAKEPVHIHSTLRSVEVGAGPEHPTLPGNGPKLSVTGVIRHISCYYPSGFEFEIETAAGRSVKLYNNDFDKIDLTAVGFIPAETMNPCKEFDGFKARASYVATADKSVDGEVVSMVLRK